MSHLITSLFPHLAFTMCLGGCSLVFPRPYGAGVFLFNCYFSKLCTLGSQSFLALLHEKKKILFLATML